MLREFRVGRVGAVSMSVALVAMSALSVIVPSSTAYAAVVAPVALGVASTFVVLSPAAVANTAGCCTTVRGDLGVGGLLSGFGPLEGTYTGNLYSGATQTAAPLAAVQAAYDDARDRQGGTVISPAAVVTRTFLPGVHTGVGAVGAAAGVTITLDAQNAADAVFIFQVNGALTMGANTQMLLTNGAQAKNVFWQVLGGFSVGASSSFIGTVLVRDAVDIGVSTLVNGRVLSTNGAIALNNNQMYFPAIDVTITSGTLASTSTPTITGTTTGSTADEVTVTVQGQAAPFTVIPDADRTWSITAPSMPDGTYAVVASVTDDVENVGSDTQQLTVDTVDPIVTINGGDVLTNDLTPTISGTTDVAEGRVVTVTFVRISPAASITATTLAQTGTTTRLWNVTPSTLSVGAWTITATVSDPAGNPGSTTQSLTIDATPPVVTITGGATALTNDPTPALGGTTSDGTVAVAIDGLTVSGVVMEGSGWTVAYPALRAALSGGDHHIAVTGTDAAGNVTVVTQTLTVDATLPTIAIDNGAVNATNDQTPIIAGTTSATPGGQVEVTVNSGSPVLATIQSNGTWNTTLSSLSPATYTIVASVSDAAQNIGTFTQSLTIDIVAPTLTINGGPSRSTGDATPAISGTSTGVALGSIVTVDVDGQSLSTSTTSGGAWTVTAAHISNVVRVVAASVSDAAGNVGSNTQSLTINAVMPTLTITGGATQSTTDATPTIAGSSSAATGSAVVVVVGAQTLNATVQPGGSWNVTSSSIGDTTVTVTATVTDPDGNVGAATQDLTINSNAPTIIAIAGGTSRSSNDDTPTLSGTTDAADDRTITVTVDGQSLPVLVDAGTWSVTAVHIADGTYTVEASVSSAGGNPGSASQSLSIDTVAPVVVLPGGGLIVTTDTTPAITGYGAAPGATVTVTVAGQMMTTTVGANGTWSVTPTIPLVPGAHTVVVTIDDAAGNVGTGSQVINVANSATAIPDFNSVGPSRVFDTRPGQSPLALRVVAKQQVGGGYELQVKMTDLSSLVPAAGVEAVSLNVTSTGSTAAGFITVYGCGTRELVSSVNFAAGGTVANAVVAPVSASGMMCFYANTPTDVIVDVNGWFASGAAYTPVGPKRVFDTRPGNSPDALRTVPKTKIAADSMIEVRLTDLAGYIPGEGVGAVSLNVTVTNPDASGFITVYPCGARTLVSSINYVAGQTVANAVMAPVSTTGTACFYSLAGTDLIVDINGWLMAGSEFNAIDPARVLDTRRGNSPDALRVVPKVKIGGTSILEVRVVDLVGRAPAEGVSAVSLNVTATNPDAGGFLTVFPCGAIEQVSSLNFGAGATVANAVIAPVSASGTICLFSNVSTDVIVDINGWIGSFQAG